jgi:hypothetical protein
MEALVLVSIFLAIASSVLGFMMLMRYRSFGSEKAEILDRKLNSVNNALDSCERMIDELNKLSDYIISNVEEKSSELKSVIDKADEKINMINSQPKQNFEARVEPEMPKALQESQNSPLVKLSGHFRKVQPEVSSKEKIIPEINSAVAPRTAVNAYKANSGLANPEKAEEPPRYIVDTVVIDDKDHGRDNGKMFAFVVSSKAKDVIELSKQGVDSTEIAKRLGIGKGEIELILGIKK